MMPDSKLCVLGHGIAYSRSPLIHGYWIRKYRLNAEYGICDVDESGLEGIIQLVRDGRMLGCNVTVPYKQKIIQFLDELDEPSHATMSVNTIYQQEGKLRGTSTDGLGYLNHLKINHPGFDLASSKVLILGAGGAARSILATMLEAGVSSLVVANRTKASAEALISLDPKRVSALDWDHLAQDVPSADLLVNTTSLGMTGRQSLVLDVALTKPSCIVSDIVYSPLQTELLGNAILLGRPVLDGLGMLLHQAVAGFQLWFGITPEVSDELRHIVEQDLLSNG